MSHDWARLYAQHIAKIASEHVEDDLKKIEVAAKEAVRKGIGVFVMRHADGTLKSAEPHSYVPKGTIYEAREPFTAPMGKPDPLSHLRPRTGR